ncbi:PTS fructose transporter subunit IIC [Bacillus sp. 522_BSPC]|uniref:PTS fructose transporter subunit IIC n=1 Tax=Bacillus sp. 522_BSPC TaxID=1579338 RepID=UPI0022AE9345|nr:MULTISPECIES: PTS fructose transporter subunit IIC [unclassified Bacillus (in: firmicutes)]
MAKRKFTFYKHMMTGVSYMIPVVAMGGLLISIGTMLGGVSVIDSPESFAGIVYFAGKTAMALVVPVLTAFIAYSIADRPGIAPGLLLGTMAVANGTGFLGGIIAGYFIGYVSLFIKKKLRVPSAMEPLVPVLIIPLLSGIIGALFMSYIIAPPISAATAAMITMFKEMGTSSKFLFGAILGALPGVDMAGPIGKIFTTVATGMMAEGIFEPNGAKVCCCMVPPLALGISSTFMSKKKYTKNEKEAGKPALILGLCQVTEGGLPFLLANPLRVFPATAIGCSVTGGIAMVFGVTAPVTMGGIFALPVMGNPIGAVIAVTAGVIVAVALLAILRKDVEEEEVVKEEELKMDISIKVE